MLERWPAKFFSGLKKRYGDEVGMRNGNLIYIMIRHDIYVLNLLSCENTNAVLSHKYFLETFISYIVDFWGANIRNIYFLMNAPLISGSITVLILTNFTQYHSFE
jgi:hypothetical protein